MNVAIITWNTRSEYLLKLFEEHPCFDMIPVCVTDNDCHQWGTRVGINNVTIVSPGTILELYKAGKIDCAIMPSLSEGVNISAVDLLLSYGIPIDFLKYAPIEVFEDKYLSDSERIDRICSYASHSELEAMEIHVTDHCNMKCKNCTMFAGLVEGEVYADFPKYEAGIHKLHSFFSHVKIFRVLGGEPLLNPELYLYLYLIRQTFPYTDIRLICNGTLLTSINHKLIQAIKDTKTTVYISHYLPISIKADTIHAFLSDHDISHSFSAPITHFNKVYNAKGDTDMEFAFKSCFWRKHGCETMREGKIATCFVPFAIPYLSDHFHLNIPEDGIIDLFEPGLTLSEIRRRLHTPFNTCKYCCLRGHSEPWDTFDSITREEIKTWSI